MILGKQFSTNQKDLDFTEDLSATLRNACMQFLESCLMILTPRGNYLLQTIRGHNFISVAMFAHSLMDVDKVGQCYTFSYKKCLKNWY